VDTIVVWDRFPFRGDVGDFTFITVESHFPRIEYYQDHVEVGVSRQGYGWCDTEGNHRRGAEPLRDARCDRWGNWEREEVL